MKKIFVACPIGSEGSDQRIRSDQLLKHVISPVAEENNLEIVRADKIGEPGRITLQIAKEIGSSDILLVDLSDLNPNVMYELGVRHGLGLNYILLAEEGLKLPFDLLDYRTIFYKLDLDGVEKARDLLKDQISASLNGKGAFIDRSTFDAPELSKSKKTEESNRMDVVINALDHFAKENEKMRTTFEYMVQIMNELLVEKQKTNEIMAQDRVNEFSANIMESIIKNEGIEGLAKAVNMFSNVNNVSS